jgi:acetyltransferase-like isoleucine patch superfamily enzyme
MTDMNMRYSYLAAPAPPQRDDAISTHVTCPEPAMTVTVGSSRVAPDADVRPSARLGTDTYVWGGARVHDGVVIGDHCSIGELAYVGRNARIGSRVRIGAQSHITDHMVIGHNVFISPCVAFANDRHPRPFNPTFMREAPVVEDDVSVGMNATILPGVRLGRGCVVGAGAVVTKDVAPYTTVVGNPARPIA